MLEIYITKIHLLTLPFKCIIKQKNILSNKIPLTTGRQNEVGFGYLRNQKMLCPLQERLFIDAIELWRRLGAGQYM